MATLPTRTFTDLVRGQVAAIQGAAAGIMDFTVGSIMRAVVEANAQVVLWLQGMALTILSTTRASTSVGPDLDSWMADYDFEREQAFAAYGLVTFTRSTPSQAATVAIGASVETQDGSVQYIVTLDTTNTLYSADLGGYVMPDGIASASVPVTCAVAGSIGNAAQGAINTITQAMPGIDTVTNPLAFVNGVDAEQDPAFRVRFKGYIGSLSKATKAAIEYALSTLGADVTYSAVENQTYAGVAKSGFFYVVVDDGTGTPSVDFLANATTAIEATRGFTIQYAVYPPQILTATVYLVVTVASGYNAGAVYGLVQAAISEFIDNLELGDDLPFTRLAQVAYDASPGVSNVSGVTLNGLKADITATLQQVVKAGTITVAAPTT